MILWVLLFVNVSLFSMDDLGQLEPLFGDTLLYLSDEHNNSVPEVINEDQSNSILPPVQNDRLTCTTCKSVFKSYSGLVAHRRIHLTNPPTPKKPCPFCGKKFTYKANLEKHIKREHAQGLTKSPGEKYTIN